MSSAYERKLRKLLEGRGWLVVRSAGSEGKGDLVCIKPEHENSPCVVEVKKTQHPEKHYCSYDPEQFYMMSDHAARGINSCYAVRHTTGKRNNRWRVHWLDGNEEKPLVLNRSQGERLEDSFN